MTDSGEPRAVSGAGSDQSLRCLSILSMISLSSSKAIIFISPPQRGQISGSTSQIFLISSRHFFDDFPFWQIPTHLWQQKKYVLPP